MSGNKYLFDTNALIGFFNKTTSLSQFILQDKKAPVPIISRVEFLPFRSLTQQEKDLFSESCQLADVIEIKFKNIKMLNLITSIRMNNKLKLPDAIIAASAILYNATLITNDKQFSNVSDLRIFTF